MPEREIPFVPIDALHINIKRDGMRCKLNWEVRCDNVFKVSGTDRDREFENASIRHDIVLGLAVSLKEVVPREIMKVGLNHRIREVIAGALTNEPYLMQMTEFIPIEKQGSSAIYPPNGRFLDVSVEVEDTWDFLIVDGQNVRFVMDPGKRTTPSRLLFASATKEADYGYIEAKQGKSGIYVPKAHCPKQKVSPKVDKNSAYCMVVHPKGHMPETTECGGFGGYSDGRAVCRYLRKMTARKQQKS